MKHLICCLPLAWMRMESICIQANDRQHIRCFIPQAVSYSLMLLKMGITKLPIAASSWLFSSLYIIMMHGQTNITWVRISYVYLVFRKVFITHVTVSLVCRQNCLNAKPAALCLPVSETVRLNDWKRRVRHIVRCLFIKLQRRTALQASDPGIRKTFLVWRSNGCLYLSTSTRR